MPLRGAGEGVWGGLANALGITRDYAIYQNLPGSPELLPERIVPPLSVITAGKSHV